MGHLPLAPVTLSLSVENKEYKRTYTKLRRTKRWWEGTNKKAKSSKATPSKPQGKNYVAMASMTCAMRSPADNRKSPS